VNWFFNHQTAEKVLFGLIAVTVFVAIASMNGLWGYLNGKAEEIGVNPYAGLAAVAIAVVVFFWGRHRQRGVVVDGKLGHAKVAPSDELLEFAKKAGDLEAIKTAVDDAASVSGGLWLSYVFVLFYLGVAAGAVTHVDLFFANPVRLPFLGIELPLVAFFIMAPILFLIVHAYMLVHLVMLTDKAKFYHDALDAQIKDANGEVTEGCKAIQDKLRRQLPSNIFIQFLAGPIDLRESGFGRLLRAMAWITVVVAPVLLLLMVQIQFLPYHSCLAVWTQRIALIVDLALVWWLWRRVLSGGESDATAPTGSLIAVGLGLLFSFLAITFSCAIATFPGEWQEELLAKWGRPAWAVTAHNMLFSAKPSDVTHRRLWFSNTLVLPGHNVYEDLGIAEPEKAKWRDFVFHARGRDLRGAIFSSAILPKIDFYGAQLQGASLDSAQLQGASLDSAALQGASLDSAQLQGVSLSSAALQGASFADAQLQGAWLPGAQLQGVSLKSAQLQGAWLAGAQLQGAWLEGAYLEGASFDGAQLQGAWLGRAHLEGASFADAQLQGVSFLGATLKATDLSRAYLWRSNQAGTAATLSAIGIVEDDKTWGPQLPVSNQPDRAWDDKAYEELSTSLRSFLSGPVRDDVLTRIKILDCSNPDTTLQSCDPAATMPKGAADWKNALIAKMVGVMAYRAALAESLQALFCSKDDNAASMVRTALKSRRLQRAGPAASNLIEKLLNKSSSDCPVAASLTDADRATLLSIQQEIVPVEEPGLTNQR
jgi:uncharacterized protein YjbI with pentapeptide repeats